MSSGRALPEPSNTGAIGGTPPTPGQPNQPPATPTPGETPLVALNEFLANPGPGGSEYVEVINLGREPADLRGWKVRDQSGATRAFTVTALAAGLLAADLDGLFQAAIKRNANRADRPFTYAQAWRDARSFVRGELLVERRRQNLWLIVSPSGTLLGSEKTPEAAELARQNFQELVDLAGSDQTLRQQDGRWQVLSADGERVLSEHDSRDEALGRLARMADIGAAGRGKLGRVDRLTPREDEAVPHRRSCGPEPEGQCRDAGEWREFQQGIRG